MTKKDYELIAGALSCALNTVQTVEGYTGEEALNLATLVMMDTLERENPRFDRNRFRSWVVATENRREAFRKAIEAELAKA